MKSPFDTITEWGHSKSASKDSQFKFASPAEDAPGDQRRWLPEPQELEIDAKSRRLLTAFDAFLIAIPILLMVKIVLCMVASVIDRKHQDASIDAVSNLTIFLVKFNSQVGEQ
jgi:hypothetical protein